MRPRAQRGRDKIKKDEKTLFTKNAVKSFDAMRKRAIIISPIAIFFMTFLLSMNGRQENNTDGIKKTIKYNTTSGQYFQYIYDDFTNQLLSVEQIDSITKKENGISISLESNGDTSYIYYYKQGKIMPLGLNTESNNITSVWELVPDEDIEIDPWRSQFYKTSYILRQDTAHLSYFFQNKVVFKETYYWGTRLNRDISNQHIFDSLLSVYNNITGETIFKKNCTSCHKIDKNATGPSLIGVTQKYSEAWLRSWIRNSPRMLANGDKKAIATFNKWNKTSMTCFPLPEKDMDKLMAYLKTLK